jgi:RND superfamily putative drug exporter
MTETSTKHAAPHAKRPLFAHAMRVLAVPSILGWVLFAVAVSTIAPSLEVVGETHSTPMAPKAAPSLKAMMLMGHNFKEFDSNSTVMIVVEGQQKLGPDAHRYYDSILSKLRQDPQLSSIFRTSRGMRRVCW